MNDPCLTCWIWQSANFRVALCHGLHGVATSLSIALRLLDDIAVALVNTIAAATASRPLPPVGQLTINIRNTHRQFLAQHKLI
jgi:hypothetical protein